MTIEKYFSKANKAISNSKVSDYLKSKEYFYFKHVKGTLIEEPSPSMQLGSMIDLAFSSGSLDVLRENYAVKCLKKDDPARFELQKGIPKENLVTEATWSKAIGMSEAILREPFFAWYAGKKSETQTPLFGKIVDGDLSVDICGLPDRVTEDGDTIYIDDLKTSAPGSMRSAKSWFYHFQDFGYFRQLAVYSYLKKRLKPNKKIVCRHIVVSSQLEGRYQVQLYVIPESLLIPAFYEFGTIALDIARETEWKDEPITWSSAVTLEAPENTKQ